jgi:hypothetical protein
MVEHDPIVPIFQVGEAHGTPFIAMPLLQGVSLDQVLHRHAKRPIPWVLRVGREAAAGLVPRDIKPALANPDGRSETSGIMSQTSSFTRR